MYISWLTTELVDIYVSELRTIQSLDHYLWKAGSRIHHSYLLKKEKKKRHKTDIKEKTETNTTGTPKIYYSCHKLYKPATSPHGFPKSLHCTSMFSMWLLSQQHNKNGSRFFFFVLLKCFLGAVAHSGDSSPFVVQRIRTVVDFVCWFWWEYCVHTCVWGGCHHTPELERTELKDVWLL